MLRFGIDGSCASHRTVVGTAGWSIGTRDAAHFPGAASHLHRYAIRLAGVEINSSFYRPHRRSTYQRWAASVPPSFRMAVKLPKTVTHEHRLADCAALLDAFIDEVGGLGATLGVLLVQLPPSLAFDPDLADRFFAAVAARTAVPVVCEPRHAGWFMDAADTLMQTHRVARVAADPAPVPGAGDPGGWDGLIYRRLHGTPHIYRSNYDAAALQRIRTALKDDSRRDVPVWCIFDNTAEGHALGNALALDAALTRGRASSDCG